MEVANTNAASLASAPGSVARNVGKELDKDAFLQILVSQLRNQDPLSPMEDRDFIAQMAQFSVLEQVQALNANFAFSQAGNLIGKNVYAARAAADGTVSEVFGKVTSVLTSGGIPYLEVSGEYIPYDQNLIVYDYSGSPQDGGQDTGTAAT